MRFARCLVTVLALLTLIASSSPLQAFEAQAVKEAAGIPFESPIPACQLAPNRNGTCANYRWYNTCSGYIWILSGFGGQGAGVRFGGPENPCVWPGNTVKRAITYFRGTVPSYNQTVNVFLDVDSNSDGCPDRLLAGNVGLDPGERWNCSNFNIAIPTDAASLIIRTVDPAGGCFGAPGFPSFATDGPYTQTCDPVGQPRSFYYGVNGAVCIPWRQFSPTGRNDNFLYQLIIDGVPNSSEATTWGRIKSTFH